MKQNNNRNEIPSRKGVHLRLPSSEKKEETTKEYRKSTQTNPQSPVKQRTSSDIAKTHKHKTPAELSRESLLKDKKRIEAIRRASTPKKELEKRHQELKDTVIFIADKSKDILISIGIGICLALLALFLYYFTFYISISKFNEKKINYEINFFDYIDPYDDNEKTAEIIKKRNEGTDKPIISLNDKLKIIDNNAYIPYSSILDYFDFSISGDQDSRVIIIGNSSGHYAEKNTAVFFNNSNNIYVNGSVHTLKSEPLISEDDLYIPLEFFESFVKGITIKISNKHNSAEIQITKNDKQIYFTASPNTPITIPDSTEYLSSPEADYDYGIDLTQYEKHINPKNKDDYLILVNSENPLPADYIPNDLTDTAYTRKDGRETQKLRLDAEMSLQALLKTAHALGFNDLTVTSAYRSYSYQSSLYNNKLESNLRLYDPEIAEEKTTEFIAYPGTSEHQSGLACDMHNLPSSMQTFASQDVYKWLLEHCADFGFILRYPQSKEEITGIKFEPWHFRFVGRYHAQNIMSSGLSLEEYIEKIN